MVSLCIYFSSNILTVLFKKVKISTPRLYIVTLLLNLYAEYITRNGGMDEAQTGIKIARRNSNNLRYADNTTFMAESEEDF